MCAGCALTAMAGATGARTWLQAHTGGRLTPRRLKAITIGLFVTATLASTVTVSGSSVPTRTAAHHAAATAAR